MELLELAKSLINCRSVTPEDGGAQKILQAELEKLGFKIENLPFGKVSNFWARLGTKAPLIVFAGHTDVVPPGPESEWQSPPFQASVRDGYLYGRGAADMKSSIAAMVDACQHFLQQYPKFNGSIGFLITSDEEGPTNEDGTVRVVEHLQKRKEKIDFCIVGEASCHRKFGDAIKIGRRGSLSAYLTIHGKQGHVAYPHKSLNPIHQASAFLQEFTQQTWDQGNEFFPPTSMQISNIQAGTGALNVIPGSLKISFNFRYNPTSPADVLQNKVISLLKKHNLNYEIEWLDKALPFLSKQGRLSDAAVQAVQMFTQITPELKTDGGTSDARFIAPTGAEVLEFGPINSTIHQVNECVSIEELQTLSKIYCQILTLLLG